MLSRRVYGCLLYYHFSVDAAPDGPVVYFFSPLYLKKKKENEELT
jgi:hypothetical protein